MFKDGTIELNSNGLLRKFDAFCHVTLFTISSCMFYSRYGLARQVGPGNNKVISPTYNSYASPTDQGKIAKEIERRAAELGKSSEDRDDNAPFNFRVIC